MTQMPDPDYRLIRSLLTVEIALALLVLLLDWRTGAVCLLVALSTLVLTRAVDRIVRQQAPDED